MLFKLSSVKQFRPVGLSTSSGILIPMLLARCRTEIGIFLRCSASMRILMIGNMIYALVIPVIEIFVSAFVLRNSRGIESAILYQIAVYTATPCAFFLNGLLLGRVAVKHLYATGMLLSGMGMIYLMMSSALTPCRVAAAGAIMGIATGIFWANRGYLALVTTEDNNRNYYFGTELFAFSLASVAVPALIGWLISGTAQFGWMGGIANHAYRLIALVFFLLTVLSAGMIQCGTYRNPPRTRFVYFHFHALWHKMLQLATLKGMAQGYMLTAPTMLILMFVGKEGMLGLVQSIGGILSACLLYATGRIAAPQHRQRVFTSGLILYFAGTLASAFLFNAEGVLIFIACLLLAKPFLDFGYSPMELQMVDLLMRRENRSAYAYLFHHEFGLFAGRVLGCCFFLAIAHWESTTAALRYTLPLIAMVQLLSIPLARKMNHELQTMEA